MFFHCDIIDVCRYDEHGILGREASLVFPMPNSQPRCVLSACGVHRHIDRYAAKLSLRQALLAVDDPLHRKALLQMLQKGAADIARPPHKKRFHIFSYKKPQDILIASVFHLSLKHFPRLRKILVLFMQRHLSANEAGLLLLQYILLPYGNDLRAVRRSHSAHAGCQRSLRWQRRSLQTSRVDLVSVAETLPVTISFLSRNIRCLQDSPELCRDFFIIRLLAIILAHDVEDSIQGNIIMIRRDLPQAVINHVFRQTLLFLR